VYDQPQHLVIKQERELCHEKSIEIRGS
jgi:hypothetical protein